MEKKRENSSKKAEEALKESEEKLRFLLKNIPDLVMTVDRNHKILMVNHSMGDISVELATGTQLYNYIEHSHHKIIRKSLEKVFRTGIREKFEVLGIGPKGPNTTWYETRVIPNKIEDKVVSVTLISLDITERKKAEEGIKKGKEFSENLITSMKDGFSVLDEHGVAINVNPALCKMTGFKKEELIGAEPPHPYWPEEELENIQKAFKKTLSGKFEDFELVFKRKNGKRFPVIVSPSQTKDANGKVTSYYATVKDITERKKAEEKLKLFSNAVKNSIDGINITDLNGNITYCNEASAKMLGYKQQELIGKHVESLIAEPRTLAKEITSSIKKIGGWSGEFLQKRKDGSVFPASLTTSIIKDEKGIPLGMMGILRDITERKKAEEELENIFNLSPDMIAVCTTEGKFLKVSPSWERVLGYTQKELLKLGWAKLVHPDDVEHTNMEVEKQLKGNSVVNFVNRYKCKDGTYKILEWWATFSKEGIVHATARDITDRKKAEEELHTSHSNISAIIENTDDYILISDENARPIMFNSAYAKVMKETLGVDMKPGLQPHKLLPNKKMVAWWDSLHRRVLGGEKFRAVYSHEFKKGNIRHFEVSYHPIVKKGKVSGFTEFTRDITERKKAEETLKESEEKFKFVSDNMQEGLWITDSGDKLTYFNRKMEEISGVKRQDVIGLSIVKDFPKGTTEHFLPSYLKAKKTLKPTHYESKVVTPAGRKTIQAGWIIPKAGDGKYNGIVCTIEDVTERKQAEEKIRISEERLKILFENAPDGIYLMDLKGNFVDGNKTAEKIIGYKREEIIGKNMKELNLLAANQIPRAVAGLVKNALGRPTGPDEYKLKRKDGSETDVEIRTFPMKIHGKTLVMGIARDITERKKAEEELRIKDIAIQSSINAIAIADIKGNLTYVNDSFVKMWGYGSDKEVLGKASVKFWYIEKKASEIIKALEKKESWVGELTAKKKDSTLFDAELSATVVKDEAGRPVCVMASFIDITVRKKAEQEREDYTAQLEEKTAELELINAKLKEQTNTLERFRDATSDHIIEMKETEEENVKLKQEIDKLKKT